MACFTNGNHHAQNFPKKTLSFYKRCFVYPNNEGVDMCIQTTKECDSTSQLAQDSPHLCLLSECHIWSVHSFLSTMSQFGQKLCDHSIYKPQWVEKQNPQLSCNSSNTLEQVTPLISEQRAKQQFIISSHHNALYASMIPSQESLRVLYEASHFCNICDIIPKLPMTSVAQR